VDVRTALGDARNRLKWRRACHRTLACKRHDPQS
jgi:hypothetical protein